ncbi:VPS36 [Candida pseudojiufengensis]|uniref:VPS36 n=1 Tax=Candida pseudojiufengensis TaxID=497109 RepID=UPI0022246E8A|nr:VPS36 [Candida pseudojiufengensis]KAI5960558.1 VPS36 [Candida pseudojiufengensis]
MFDFESINKNYYYNYIRSYFIKPKPKPPTADPKKDQKKKKQEKCFVCKRNCFICKDIKPIPSDIEKGFKQSYLIKNYPPKYIKGEYNNIKPDLNKSFKNSSVFKQSKSIQKEFKTIKPDLKKGFKDRHSPNLIVFKSPSKKKKTSTTSKSPPTFTESDFKTFVLFIEILILMAIPFYFIIKFDHQNGRLYLTNKRVIYFDNSNINNCIAIDLNKLHSVELIEKFLRSSPKVKLFLKKDLSNKQQQNELKGIDWVCKICSFNNHIPPGFNWDEDDLPKCISCGIRPTRKYIEGIMDSSKESTPSFTVPPPSSIDLNNNQSPSPASTTPEPSNLTNGQCPTCTFINHKSIKYCEMCGTELSASTTLEISQSINEISIENNPLNLKLESQEIYTNDKPYIKISFRKGGEQKFFQEIANLIDEIKWENLRKRGGINQNSTKLQSKKPEIKRTGAGIHALELIGEQQRKNNEIILSSSLEDLEQLMFKFKDILNLSSTFNGLINNKNGVTKSLPPININKSSNLYHSELSRHISEYLINFKLTKNSSMITLQDSFADYNRFLVKSQGFGCELIDVNDFKKSIELFNNLNLPVILNKYEKSELIVIKPRIHANVYDEFIIQFLNNHEHQYKINKLKNEMIDSDNNFNSELNYGCTISEISHFFNWSYSITKEELEKLIENGKIVIDQNISGTFYYVNKFSPTYDWDDSKEIDQIKNDIINEQNEITKNLKMEYNKLNLNNLININPDYEFGNLVDENSIVSDSTPSSINIPSNVSLNGLEGLKF